MNKALTEFANLKIELDSKEVIVKTQKLLQSRQLKKRPSSLLFKSEILTDPDEKTEYDEQINDLMQ
jgi:hypothetical protein